MSDKATLVLALEKLNVSIEAIIKLIGTGRGIQGAAFDFNNMLQAKANIEKLLAAIPTLNVVKSKKK
jgi:hypothetical protein